MYSTQMTEVNKMRILDMKYCGNFIPAAEQPPKQSQALVEQPPEASQALKELDARIDGLIEELGGHHQSGLIAGFRYAAQNNPLEDVLGVPVVTLKEKQDGKIVLLTAPVPEKIVDMDGWYSTSPKSDFIPLESSPRTVSTKTYWALRRIETIAGVRQVYYRIEPHIREKMKQPGTNAQQFDRGRSAASELIDYFIRLRNLAVLDKAVDTRALITYAGMARAVEPTAEKIRAKHKERLQRIFNNLPYLTDERVAALLESASYYTPDNRKPELAIARRTVTEYRRQLGIANYRGRTRV